MRRDLSDTLHARVGAFIRGASNEDFDALACDIARFQAEHVEPIGRLFKARSVGELTSADDIPAVPTDAFRLRRIAAHPPDEDERVFHTSGTASSRTTGVPGKHAMRTTDTYSLAALTWARHMLFRDTAMSFIAHAPTETDAPHSSLSFMLARFAEVLTGGDATLVAGTSFAFVHLIDAGVPRPLPAGSRIMQTGGFKGRSREIDKDELRTALADLFACEQTQIIGEYGMTELSSQLYDSGDDRYRAPPWLRVTAVDPETLAARTHGLARFVDLANVDSAIAIQTQDLITMNDDGSITLHGRAPGATPRGCSLAMEHLIS